MSVALNMNLPWENNLSQLAEEENSHVLSEDLVPERKLLKGSSLTTGWNKRRTISFLLVNSTLFGGDK